MKLMDLSRFVDLRPRFFGEAGKLRAVFEKRFSDPRRTFATRFVWDYWHIENQYTVLRTPARSFFPKALFDRFENQLLGFGGKTLGCNGISEPWLSYYVDGCSQNLHSDNPHGPWAYVYSLTPWKGRRFTGGETLITRPELTQYWEGFDDRAGREVGDFFVEVPALMNQLFVFDPRLPHGVKEVRGAKDPRQGRLVIHGWFTEPRPFVEGSLARYRSLAGFLDESLRILSGALSSAGAFHGSLTFRLEVRASGEVARVVFLKNTLIPLGHPQASERGPEGLVRRHFRDTKFPRMKGPSSITVPLLYRS